MPKKRTLLDALKERQNQPAKSNAALEVAGGAGQLMQAGGAAASLAPGPGAVIGAVMTLGGMFLGNIASSFQTKRMREEIEFVADCVDKLSATWAQDGTLEEHILPAVVKHMTWRTQESHREKVNAARIHLRKKLLEGAPSPESDALHQQVERFLTDCTVSELVLLLRLSLALRTNDEIVEQVTSRHTGELTPVVKEEEIAESANISFEEAYYAFRSLSARGFVIAIANTARDNDSTFLGGSMPASQNMWALMPMGEEIAEWLDENAPSPHE